MRVLLLFSAERERELGGPRCIARTVEALFLGEPAGGCLAIRARNEPTRAVTFRRSAPPETVTMKPREWSSGQRYHLVRDGSS